MIALLPALSLSNKLLEVGALAAFAALVGIAVLSLLVFSQARELKRLREWAGRAPERAAELEQRVNAEAAIRAQRAVQPRVGGVPRPTPMIARPVAGQPPAPAPTASGQLAVGTPAAAGQPVTAGQVAPDDPPPSTPVPSAAPLPAPVPGQPAFVPTAQTVAGAALVQPGSGSVPAPSGAESEVADASTEPASTQPDTPAEIEPAAPDQAAGEGEQQPPVAEPVMEPAAEPAVAAAGAIAPATVAAAASTAVASRVLEPPRPAVPRAPVPPAPARPGVAPALPAAAPVRSGSPRPPAPVPPRAAGVRASRGGERAPGYAGGAPPRFLVEEERSRRKAVALIVGGVLVGVVVLAVVLLSGGGAHNPSAGNVAQSSAHGRGGQHGHGTAVASPAQTQVVVVLNATEANGLAHKLAEDLRQSGYGQASASSAHPPNARSTSVVQYASGHRPEAQHVAQTLGIGEVTQLEGAIAQLVNGASVVVIAGADKASLVGAPTEAPAGEAEAGAAQGSEAPANAG